jgi:hypothetical protein
MSVKTLTRRIDRATPDDCPGPVTRVVIRRGSRVRT